MAYIGQQPVVGRYILLDQISGGFNGTTSGFTMSTAGGVQGVKPGLAQNVLLSLGGVIQQPGVDYTISGSGITFTTPPVAGTTFFATVLGDAQSVGTPSDGTVTPASIAAGYDFAFPNVNVTGVTTIASGVAATPSLSITGDADTGLFSSAANTVAVTTSGVQRLSIDGAGNVGIAAAGQQASYTDYAKAIVFGTSSETTVGLVLRTGTSGTSSIAFADNSGSGSGAQDGLIEYSQTNRALAFSTATSERMLIDSSGRLVIGEVHTLADFSNNLLNIAHASGAGIQIGRKDTSVAVDNLIGAIQFRTDTGSGANYQSSASIEVYAEDTHAVDDSPGRIIFNTTSDGSASPTERMQIDNAGRVGIGTTSPGALLHLQSTTSASLRIKNVQNSTPSVPHIELLNNNNQGLDIKVNRSGSDSRAIFAADTAISVDTDGDERLRIDSNGRLMVGLSSSVDSNSALQVEGRNTITAIRYSAPAGNAGSKLELSRSASNTIGTTAAVSATDELGEVRFRGATSDSTFNTGAVIAARVESGTISSSSFPTALLFSTTANGSSSSTERMRIDNQGRLLIGTTSQSNSALLTVEGNTGNNSGSGELTLQRGEPATSMSSGDSIGHIYFQDNSNNRFAEITARSDGASGSNDYPGRLMFHTTADGASSVTERMRIDSDGRLMIGSTTSPSGGDGHAEKARLLVRGRVDNNDDSGRINLQRGSAASNGSSLGSISFTDNSNNIYARIEAFGDATTGTDDYPGRITFSTTADGANSVTERLRINSSGKVGINSVAESSALLGIGVGSTSELSDSSGLYNQGNPAFFQIKNTTDDISDPECGIILQPRNSSNGAVALYAKRTGSFTSDLIYRVRTGSSTSAERIRFRHGGGITFNGDTAAVNALDDYEEGTWTPGVLRSTTNPTVATSYATGKYTKIGNQVFVYFDLNMTTLSGGSGRYYIYGLPFSSSTDSNSGGYGAPQFRDSNAFPLAAQQIPSSYHSGTTIQLRYMSSATSESDIAVTTGRITGWSVYFTNS